jgi:hypothetical protein
VRISERIEAARRERRVLARVSRAAWRLEQAERERTWALVSARAEGISIRTLVTAIGLSPSRVHQIVADADLDALDAALGELRAAGWPTPVPYAQDAQLLAEALQFAARQQQADARAKILAAIAIGGAVVAIGASSSK